jgi:hypothetical protein
MRLEVLPGTYAVWRLPPRSERPALPRGPGEVTAVVVSDDEVSVVGPQRLAPRRDAEFGFRVLKVEGPLDFGLVGVIASLVDVLASLGMSVFVFSTFDTDYLLVRERDLARSMAALSAAGHVVGPVE